MGLSRELKRLWNIKGTVIPIAVGTLGTDLNGLKKRLTEFEIRGRIQPKVLSRLAKIFRRVLETCGDLLLLWVHWKIVSWRWREKHTIIKITIICQQAIYKKWKRTGDLHANSKNIQPSYRNGIWHSKICHAQNENGKRNTTERIEQPNQEIIRTLGEKENYKYLGILKKDNIKQAETKEKISRVLKENKKTSRYKALKT